MLLRAGQYNATLAFLNLVTVLVKQSQQAAHGAFVQESINALQPPSWGLCSAAADKLTLRKFV